jgi:hypothetical protein
MGVFFRRERRAGALPERVEAAVSPHIEAALRQPPPDTEGVATQRHDDLTRSAASAAAAAATPGAMQPNWRGFSVALGLFLALLAITIFLDWKNVVDDPKVYSGMAGTVLGALLGFLSGEAVGTASSE